MSNDQTIEVDFRKIIDWLNERRKLPEDWNRRLKAIKLKQKQLIESTLQTQGNYELVNYIESKKDNFSFVDLLWVVSNLNNQNSQVKNKSFFGSYSNSLIKDWIGLSKLYQSHNLHIVDLAKVMIQNAQYDIPGLRKSQSAIQQQIITLNQKIIESKLQIKQILIDYDLSCKKNGIIGNDVEKEVPAMVSQLPIEFQQISNLFLINRLSILGCIKYYQDFTLYACEKSQINEELQLLKSFCETGDIPVENYEQKQLDQIDMSRVYQWYYDHAKSNDNFGINELNNDQQVNVSSNQEDTSNDIQEIDWTKYIVEEETQNIPIQSPFVETLLSSQTYRNELLSNLFELQYFIKSRIFSSKQHSENALLSTYEDKQELFDFPIHQLSEYENIIKQIQSKLVSSHFRTLLTLMKNTKAQNRIVDHLKSFHQARIRAEQSIKNSIQKQSDLESDHHNIQQTLTNLIEQTQQSKELAEKYLTELAKNWKVQIIGDINKIK